MKRAATWVRALLAGALLTTAVAMPVEDAAAQNVLGGALLGGAAGAVIGGAVTGRAGGAIIGGALGAATGAMIAQQAQRRRNGYYYYQRKCYWQAADGRWYRARNSYC